MILDWLRRVEMVKEEEEAEKGERVRGVRRAAFPMARGETAGCLASPSLKFQWLLDQCALLEYEALQQEI